MQNNVQSRILTVGIDLGTTNTVVYYNNMNTGRYEALDFGTTGPLMPSVLFVKPDGSFLVGARALNKGRLDPRRMIRSSKSHMGEADFIYPDSDPHLKFEKKLTPTDAATRLLSHVKETLISRGVCREDTVIKAVITVPAYFKSRSVAATKKAGEDAGMDVIRILSEPTAAAVAYATQHIENRSKIFVVDFGGGTLDLSLLEYNDKDAEKYRVIDQSGNTRLGGDDIDEKIVAMLKEIVQDDTGIDLSDLSKSGLSEGVYYKAVAKLNTMAINLKHALSESEEYELNEDYLMPLPNGSEYSFTHFITRNDFDKYCEEVYDKFVDCISKFQERLRRERKLTSVTELSKVLLVGGSCYIPRIQTIVKQLLGDKVQLTELSQIVAEGALITANEILHGPSSVKETLSYDLGVGVLDDNDQECFSLILPRGMQTPTEVVKRNYETAYAGQKEVIVNIYERSDNVDPSDNRIENCSFYGSVVFNDYQVISNSRQGIDVSFQFDANRILTVKVEDVLSRSYKEVAVTMTGVPVQPQKTAALMDIYILVDASGSMEGERLTDVKKAVTKLVKEMIDMRQCRVGLFAFANESEEKRCNSLTNNADDIIRGVNSIIADGCTYAAGAFTKAMKDLNAAPANRKKVVIMLTDGVLHDAAKTEAVTESMRKQGIRVITIGAALANISYLRKIASVKADGKAEAYPIDDMHQLEETFRHIVNTLRES